MLAHGGGEESAVQQVVVEAPTTRENFGPSLELLYPYKLSSEDAYISADVIAIHGLGSDPRTTWTCDDGDNGKAVNWLKDSNMLPSLVPDARIWAFGYNSKWTGDVPVQRIEWLAEQVLTVIHDRIKRLPNRLRPIIFVAHSFGGIVLAAALTSRSIRLPKYAHILESTAGAIFLGTPFSGASRFYAYAGLCKARYKQITGQGGETTLLKAMMPGFQMIDTLRPALVELATSENLQMLCFFEQYRTTLLPKARPRLRRLASKFVVSPDQSVLEPFEKLALARTHQKLNEFPGPSNNDYRILSGAVQDFVHHAPRVLRDRRHISISPPFSNIPYARNRHFATRTSLMRQIRNALDKHGKCVVYGMGGSGKSQLAIEYAYQEMAQSMGKKYPSSDMSFFWIQSRTWTSFEKSYMDMAKLVGVFDETQTSLMTMERVKAWLETPASGFWLLVFDNLDDIDLLQRNAIGDTASNPEQINLGHLIPVNPNGQVIFTTRDRRLLQDVNPHMPMVKVESLSSKEASQLIREHYSGQHLMPAEVSRLSTTLHGSPFAIAQASVFVQRKGLSIAEFLANFGTQRDFQIAALSERFDAHGREDNPTAFSQSWKEAFNIVDRQVGDSTKHVLGALAVLEHLRIQKDLLIDPDLASRDDAKRCLGILQSFSIITPDKGSDKLYSVDLLVQVCLLAYVEQGGRDNVEATITSAMESVTAQLPLPSIDTLDVCKMYLPHIESLLGHGDRYSLRNDEVLSLFAFLGAYYRVLGNENKAAYHYQCAVEVSTKVLGKEHTRVHSLMLELSASYSELARFSEAETLAAEVVQLREASLAPDHPAILQSKTFLADRRAERAVFEEAESLLKDAEIICAIALEKQKEILPINHRDLLESEAILGKIYHRQGRHKEAATLLQLVHEKIRPLVGVRHPDLVRIRLDLAALYIDMDEQPLAKDLLKDLIATIESGFPEHHPDLLRARFLQERSLWSSCDGEAGFIKNRRALMDVDIDTVLESHSRQWDRVLPLEEILDAYRAVFGTNHPESLQVMMWLLHIRMHLRDSYRCETLAVEASDISSRLYKPEHSRRLEIMTKLVKIYSWTSKIEQSEQLGREVVDIYTMKLGREHPLTVAAMSHLLAASAVNASRTHSMETTSDLAKELLVLRKKVEDHLQSAGASDLSLKRAHREMLADKANLVLYHHNKEEWEDAAFLGHEVANDRIKTMPVGALEIIESCEIAAWAWFKLQYPLVALRFQWQAVLHSWSKMLDGTKEHEMRFARLESWVGIFKKQIPGKTREELFRFLEQKDYNLLAQLNLDWWRAVEDMDCQQERSQTANDVASRLDSVALYPSP